MRAVRIESADHAAVFRHGRHRLLIDLFDHVAFPQFARRIVNARDDNAADSARNVETLGKFRR
jgi:hypothetical protein